MIGPFARITFSQVPFNTVACSSNALQVCDSARGHLAAMLLQNGLRRRLRVFPRGRIK